jgi:predicted nuclease of restriction endonuclease-like (RecB) superfamily
MDFTQLLNQIQSTHQQLQRKSIKAINTFLTFRNWLIGFYIFEFEQRGTDRAEYGQKLILNISNRLAIKGLGETNLKLCRQFYVTYSHFSEIISSNQPEKELQNIRQFLPDQLYMPDIQINKISQVSPDESSGQSASKEELKYLLKIFENISFTHFAELVKIGDQTKRKFYEMLILKSQMSVGELKRSIETLTFERMGLSSDYQAAIKQIESRLQPAEPSDIIKSHYFFEFLNLNQPQLIEESELEQALIEHLQQFIIELGNGFCFEARQKRLLIDAEYFFIDLVFYHRILKCHVLIELKVDKFKPEYLSQLNSYVAYYNKQERQKDDHPAIGILLCAEKGHQLVEYAMAGMTQTLFVSKYQLNLPTKEQLLHFIQNELNRL